MAGKFIGSALKTYKSVLHKYPTVSQCVECAILMGSGDIIAQTVVEQKSFRNLDFKRTSQFASVGLFVVGPSMTLWYRFLDKGIGNKGTSVTIKKVLCDQLLFAPSSTALVLFILGVMRTGGVEEAKNALKRDYVDVLLANYKVWPCVQLCNFYFTPLEYQVLVVQTIALFWNSYLSWKTQRHPYFDEYLFQSIYT